MDNLKLNFRVRFVWLIVGIGLTTIFTVLSYHFKWATTPKDLVSIVTAGIGLTAVIYAALNFHLSTGIRLEELRLKRLEAAISFMDTSASPHMVKAIGLAFKLRTELKKPECLGLVELTKRNPEYEEALITVFNYFERLGIVVRMEAADETALREYFSSPVKRYWHTYAAWITAMRDEVQTTDLFSEMEWLTKRWR